MLAVNFSCSKSIGGGFCLSSSFDVGIKCLCSLFVEGFGISCGLGCLSGIGVSYGWLWNKLLCCSTFGALGTGAGKLFPMHWYAGGGVISCGNIDGSLFSLIVSNGSSLNGSGLYFLSGNGGFCIFFVGSKVRNCNPLSVLRIVVL